jgi:hypothetical protein
MDFIKTLRDLATNDKFSAITIPENNFVNSNVQSNQLLSGNHAQIISNQTSIPALNNTEQQQRELSAAIATHLQALHIVLIQSALYNNFPPLLVSQSALPNSTEQSRKRPRFSQSPSPNNLDSSVVEDVTPETSPLHLPLSSPPKKAKLAKYLTLPAMSETPTHLKTFLRTPNDWQFAMFHAISDRLVVSNKPLEFSVTSLHGNELVQFTAACKISDNKGRKRTSSFFDLPCIFFDINENQVYLSPQFAPGKNIAALFPLSGSFLYFVETKGGKTSGRQKQRYLLLKRNSKYVMALSANMSIPQMRIQDGDGPGATLPCERLIGTRAWDLFSNAVVSLDDKLTIVQPT